jgi:hypothetical protein
MPDGTGASVSEKSMFKRIFAFGVASLCTLLSAGVAQAAPTYCSSGPTHAEGLRLTDVTFRGASADDCFGVQLGNDSGANAAFIGWNGFEQLVSDESGGGSTTSWWSGVRWTLSGAANARSGNYTLSWSDPLPLDLPLRLDLIVITKASNRFASYLFQNELFEASPSSGSGTWQITYRNNGGQIPRLSHLSIWARLMPIVRVPEPSTLGLVGVGLLGIGLLARKRERHALAL